MSGRGPTALVLTFARRGEDDAIRTAMASLDRQSPGVRLIALGTPVSAPVLYRLGIEEVMVLGEARPSRRVIGEARALHPESAAVIYSGPGTGGHLKLEVLALSAGPRRIYRFLPGEPTGTLGRPALLLAVVGKSLQTAGCLIAGLLVCGVAFSCLRLAQLLAGGHGAGRH